MSRRGAATPYGGGEEGLNARAIHMLREAKVDYSGGRSFLVGRHNETAYLVAWKLPSGGRVRAEVQVEIHEPTGPQYLFALKDRLGRWIKDSLWTEAEIEEQLRLLSLDLQEYYGLDSPAKVEVAFQEKPNRLGF